MEGLKGCHPSNAFPTYVLDNVVTLYFDEFVTLAMF